MTTSDSIESAWNTYIWQNSTIQAITTKIHTFPVTELSEKEISAAYYGTRINFIEALTARTQRYQASAQLLGKSVQYDFIVLINYYKETDTTGANYGEVRDAFETIFTKVVSELGTRWNSTVDYWRPQDTPAEITQTRLDDALVWRGTFRYLATKSTTI